MDTETDERSRGWGKNHRRAKAAKAVKFGRSLYRQVAAVLGAIGIAAIVDHFWHVGWRGALASLVGVWDQTVRPAVAAIFHVLVTVPMGWLGVHVEIPLAVRDYVSVGLVLALSVLREVKNDEPNAPVRPWEDVLLIVSGFLLWPAILFLYIFTAIFIGIGLAAKDATGHNFVYNILINTREPGAPAVSQRQLKDELRHTILSNARKAAPIAYLGLLLAVNYLIFR